MQKILCIYKCFKKIRQLIMICFPAITLISCPITVRFDGPKYGFPTWLWYTDTDFLIKQILIIICALIVTSANPPRSWQIWGVISAIIALGGTTDILTCIGAPMTHMGVLGWGSMILLAGQRVPRGCREGAERTFFAVTMAEYWAIIFDAARHAGHLGNSNYAGMFVVLTAGRLRGWWWLGMLPIFCANSRASYVSFLALMLLQVTGVPKRRGVGLLPFMINCLTSDIFPSIIPVLVARLWIISESKQS